MACGHGRESFADQDHAVGIDLAEHEHPARDGAVLFEKLGAVGIDALKGHPPAVGVPHGDKQR